jgi:predicted nucleic acid-binding Zn ribbon protein
MTTSPEPNPPPPAQPAELETQMAEVFGAQAADDPVAAHAQRINDIVAAERRRRRRTLLLWSALLLPPLALAVWVILWPPAGAANFNSPEFAEKVAPIVQKNVGEQLKPVVNEQLGPRVDDLIETRVSGKIQGASPARVEEIAKGLKQVSDEMSQAQTGLRDVQAIRAELSQVRDLVGTNDSSVRNLQQRVELIAHTRGGDNETAAAIKRLEARLAEVDDKLDHSVRTLQAQLDQNSSTIRALKVKFDAMGRRWPSIETVNPPEER